jgi:hypothetical protein
VADDRQPRRRRRGEVLEAAVSDDDRLLELEEGRIIFGSMWITMPGRRMVWWWAPTDGGSVSSSPEPWPIRPERPPVFTNMSLAKTPSGG